MMSQHLLVILVSVFISSLSAVSAAKELRLLKYDVAGATAKQLMVSIRINGPDGSWGSTYQNWTYSYKWTIEHGKYKARDIEVGREIVVTMPLWRGYVDASACMKKSWDDMYRSLDNHEKTHVALGDFVSGSIESMLALVEPQASEEALSATMRAAAVSVITRHNVIQTKFDSDTINGSKDPLDPIVLKECP